jgi:hypothetical protein
MAKLEKSQSDKLFITIAEGALRQSVPEGTPDAVKRSWQAGGKTGIKNELVYNAVVGEITDVTFYEGEHEGKKFQTLNIQLAPETEGEPSPVISAGIDTKYAADLMKKLPNVDFTEEVRIRPYSYIPNGKEKPTTGVELMQREGVTGNFTRKVESYFDSYDEKAKKFTSKNGFPTPEGDVSRYVSDDWKIYFLQVKRFLVDYTKENITARFQVANLPKPVEYDKTNGIDPDAIGF